VCNGNAIRALSARTFRNAIESPIAYVAAIFFYAFVGTISAIDYFAQNQASLDVVGSIAPWGLWFVIPILTMGLLSEEMRSGTFESLATLPVTDMEIVVGKFAGFARVAALLIGGLAFFAVVAKITVQPGLGLDWGGTVGTLVALYLLCLMFGAIGLFASSLAKSQVVAVIIALMFCTFFFMAGQFYAALPGALGRLADYIGTGSHLETLGRGVLDLRDLLYFGSVTGFFLFLTVQRLSTRRF
jgi:ABC-2 type transport system permease protein